MIRAFHLPAHPDPPVRVLSIGTGAQRVELAVPELTPERLREEADALLDARARHLAGRPVSEIVRVIDGVARRLQDPGDELRRTAEAALPAVTGTSLQMVRRVLDGMAADWRAPRLLELLGAELGDPAVLDGFVERAGAPGRTRAYGPELVTQIFSGNIPGIAVTSIVRALLVKAATLGKTGSGEPLLPALFARGLAEADPALGRCLAITYWPGGDELLEEVALSAADAVIVYGRNAAIESVRSRTSPSTRLLAYGHKLSFGVLAREALSEAAAPGLARLAAAEVATFDQQGCVSPHLFYAEAGGEVEPEAFARMLAVEMERIEREVPRAALPLADAAAIRQLRGQAEFAALSGGDVIVHASPGGTAWTVIYDSAPEFVPSCLNRVVRVKRVADLGAVSRAARDIAPFLQTVGLAGSDDRLAPLVSDLAAAGASRIAPIGRMAWPPPAWHHDGRPPLRDLLRWCDWEHESAAPAGA